ncbi:uncharacterized protein CTHT_0011620 [Thermochaetoides thermophila DSM 1495]|uniref:Methyltransferase type 12 domain-containing protein n=1 Tax=Chaetomium thermophilum (strain DSM 1495 / CBS 144.50 / IMI 039719) TaxID=759272 RepID=G0S0X9_CHATD|nr:hypothetical protein CTHT_0011620 [Thermochaetoides thermophila DSM 1495]EGS22689.1 hypothetical protein CTHT_0011620 [Thermochaetoides thermophila DSM 1495]
MTDFGHHHHHVGSASVHNLEYFDKEAASYDAKHQKTLDRLIEEIRDRLDFLGVDWVNDDDNDDEDQNRQAQNKSALAPYTTQCVGIDLSANMGLAPSEMRAYQGNLCVPDDPNPAAFSGPEFFNFDIVAVGLGFHHFDDPALAARRLAERLKDGGVLTILDFLPHGKLDPSHSASATVTHHGFSEEQIRGIFEQAGVGKDFDLEEVGTVSFHISD